MLSLNCNYITEHKWKNFWKYVYYSHMLANFLKVGERFINWQSKWVGNSWSDLTNTISQFKEHYFVPHGIHEIIHMKAEVVKFKI